MNDFRCWFLPTKFQLNVNKQRLHICNTVKSNCKLWWTCSNRRNNIVTSPKCYTFQLYEIRFTFDKSFQLKPSFESLAEKMITFRAEIFTHESKKLGGFLNLGKCFSKTVFLMNFKQFFQRICWNFTKIVEKMVVVQGKGGPKSFLRVHRGLRRCYDILLKSFSKKSIDFRLADQRNAVAVLNLAIPSQ